MKRRRRLRIWGEGGALQGMRFSLFDIKIFGVSAALAAGRIRERERERDSAN